MIFSDRPIPRVQEAMWSEGNLSFLYYFEVEIQEGTDCLISIGLAPVSDSDSIGDEEVRLMWSAIRFKGK